MSKVADATTPDRFPLASGPLKWGSAVGAAVGALALIALPAKLLASFNIYQDLSSGGLANTWYYTASSMEQGCHDLEYFKSFHSSTWPYRGAISPYNGAFSAPSTRTYGPWSDFNYHQVVWRTSVGLTMYVRASAVTGTVRFQLTAYDCV